MPPLVSVVIPCYRQGRFLGDAVNALLEQSHPRIEIIVVNDGSDDDTDSVARSFGNRIVYLAQKNAGHCAARNAGIAKATGDYLYFLDADDLIHSNCIERLVAAGESGGRCVAMTGYRLFETAGQWGGGEDAPPGDSMFPWILVRNYPLHCYLLPRAIATAAGPWDTKMVTHEDHEFWLRVAGVAHVMRQVPGRDAYYRQHPESGSRSTHRMGLGRLQLLRRTTELLMNHSDLLRHHGPLFLRHLYVSRWIFAAQTPSLNRAELDDCIVRLQRAGVRTKAVVDWAYALVPKPILPTLDALALAFFRATGLKDFDQSSLTART